MFLHDRLTLLNFCAAILLGFVCQLGRAQTVVVDPQNQNTGTLVNGLRFGGVVGRSSTRVFVAGEGIASNQTASAADFRGLDFLTNDQVRLTIFNDGHMVAPGQLTVQTLQITGGADLAEPFPVVQGSLPAGTVVVIDDKNPGKLKISDRPYDAKVAGVISGAGDILPGIQMRPNPAVMGANVALTGRIYVNADTSSGAIRPGDLLTTSYVPGHCMRSTDRRRGQGAILGKAMSSLPNGQGLILALVTLQ